MTLEDLEQSRKNKELKLLALIAILAIFGFVVALLLAKVDVGMAFIAAIFCILLSYSFFRGRILKEFEPNMKKIVLAQIQKELNLKIPSQDESFESEFISNAGFENDGKFSIYALGFDEVSGLSIYDVCYAKDGKMIFYGLYAKGKVDGTKFDINAKQKELKQVFEDKFYINLNSKSVHLYINRGYDSLRLSLKTSLKNNKQISKFKSELRALIKFAQN